jgi:hypothetical protein
MTPQLRLANAVMAFEKAQQELLAAKVECHQKLNPTDCHRALEDAYLKLAATKGVFQRRMEV